MNKITKKVLSTALVFPLLYGNSFASAEKNSLPKWETMSPLQKTAAVGIPSLGIGTVGVITIGVIYDKFFANKQSGFDGDGANNDENPYMPNSSHKEEPKKVVKPSAPAKEESIDSMIAKIQKICSFSTEGLGWEDRFDLIVFTSRFDEYHQADTWDLGRLKTYLQESDKNRSEIAKDMQPLWDLVGKATIKDDTGIRLISCSEKDIFNDMKDHFERRTGVLTRNAGDFRKLVNFAHKQDGDIDLSFNQPFFNQSFIAPYRAKQIDDIFKEWGVKTKIVAGKSLMGSDLEDKLKSIIDKWFPGIEAEQKAADEGVPNSKAKYVPILEYIFGVPNETNVFDTKGDRFHSLVYSRNDAFSPTLFVKILYSFEKEAKKLGMKPKDLDDAYKCDKKFTPQQERLRTFRAAAAQAFATMSEGCCQQLQTAISKIDNAYITYQLSNLPGNVARPTIDQRFCQQLRDEATDKAVELCPKTKHAKGGHEYADFIRATFTPLVNATNTGYRKQNDWIFRDYGETYKSLALKWKDSASSTDLIKSALAKVQLGMTESEKKQFDEYKKVPISYFNFVSIIKSIDKTSSARWRKEINDFYAHIVEESKNGKSYDDEGDKQAFQDMGKWIKGEKDVTFEYLQNMMFIHFLNEIDQNSEFYKLISEAKNLNVLFYINHLAHDGLIVING